MTAQAHEKLILEGVQTSMAFCPPLPLSDPRVTKVEYRGLSSACWRGYIGSWEIKGGQLFLIGLSGRYKLQEGASIFAEWFSGTIKVPSGKILKYVHGGFSTEYEQEKYITIEDGFVVEIIEQDNTHPSISAASNESVSKKTITHSIDLAIKEFVEARKIDSLFHFTNAANLSSILENGLLGRESLLDRDIDSLVNDKYRHDHVPDAICTSISFPNYKMFYQLQLLDEKADWAVIQLDPKILWEKPCAFCYSNAASTEVSRLSLDSRLGLGGLKSMFAEVSAGVPRGELAIPQNYTTDPQAEVLVLAPIGPEYILSINFNSKEKINDLPGIISAIKPFFGRHKFFHTKQLFTYRHDYKHWQRSESTLDSSELLGF